MRTIKINDIYIVINFFSQDEINFFSKFFEIAEYIDGDSVGGLEEALDWSMSSKSEDNLALVNKAQSIMVQKYTLSKQLIEKSFNCALSSETIGTISRCREGWRLHRHIDNYDGTGLDIPTPAGHPSRDISTIIYYGTEFTGGELEFPDLSIEINPLPGSLIYFPSDKNHQHLVNPVLSGYRFTSTGFWNILEKYE